MSFWFVGIFIVLIGNLYAENPTDFEFDSEQVVSSPPASETPVDISTPPETPAESSKKDLRLGFEGSGVGSLSSVDYDRGFSGGLGWGFGINLEWVVTPKLRWVTKGGYQSLSLERYIGSSGQIQDPASLYVQTQKGPFIQVGALFPFLESAADSKEYVRLSWTVGAEYFVATEAVQTTSFNTQYPFSGSQFLFLLAGTSLSWKVRSDWELSLNALFFINSVGSSSFEFFGGRVGLALNTPL